MYVWAYIQKNSSIEIDENLRFFLKISEKLREYVLKTTLPKIPIGIQSVTCNGLSRSNYFTKLGTLVHWREYVCELKYTKTKIHLYSVYLY